MHPPDRRLEHVFSGRNKTFPPQQKTDNTVQLYCTLSTYVTPKTISRQNQKTNTTPQLYGSTTKIYFPPEPKTDTTAQPARQTTRTLFSGRNKTFPPQQKN
jgi:hypothetical protein